MPKRTVCLLLTVILMLGLFSGCNLQMTMLPQTTKPPATKPSVSLEITEPTQPVETTRPTEIPQPTQPVDLEQPKEDPVRPTTMPADVPNLEKGVYATCGNYYYTIYMDAPVSNTNIVFYLMTEEPLPEDAEIITGLQTNHKVRIQDRTPKTAILPDELEALARGSIKEIDWTNLYKTQRDDLALIREYQAGKISLADCQAARQKVWLEECANLGMDPEVGWVTPDDELPVNFFYYEVTIYISHFGMEEELTSVELIAGDMSRTIPVGEIRLRKKVDPETKELNQKALIKKVSSNLPYPNLVPSVGGDQYTIANGARVSPQQKKTFRFIAKEDITLTEVYFFANGGENCKIIGADVVLTPTDGIRQATGNSIQMQWTPGTPLQVRKNELVQVQVCYVDSWYQLTEYAALNYMILEYQCGTETGRVLSPYASPLRKWDRPCELYLWAFTDVDIEGYYKEFYFPYLKYRVETGEFQRIPSPT